MPAVNPTRLRFQVEGLLAHFHSPTDFHKHLRDLFELYAHNALRLGESVGLKPLIPVYHLPAPVIRQLNADLRPRAQSAPQQALALADELWTDPYLEIKQTALFLLGLAPVDSPEPVLDRLKAWLQSNPDPTLAVDLFSVGTRQLQKSHPERWEGFIQSLLSQTDPAQLNLGIMGLTEAVKNSDFKNLPAIFRLISPVLRQPNRALLPSLSRLINVLADQSPTETAFFLRQTLSLTTSETTQRLVKRSLPFFSEQIQLELKSLLQE